MLKKEELSLFAFDDEHARELFDLKSNGDIGIIQFTHNNIFLRSTHDQQSSLYNNNSKYTATLNRVPCAAHTLQLCVQAAFKSECMQDVIKRVRETCKFFCKSSVGATNLLDAQKCSKVNTPSRLLLDVRTRWGSTVSMMKRYLNLRPYVENATENLFKFIRLKYENRSLLYHLHYQKLAP